MKKVLLVTLLLTTVIALFSCKSVETTESADSSSAESTTTEVIQQFMPPADYGKIYTFDSYEELQSAVNGEDSQAFMETVTAKASRLVPLLSHLAQLDELPKPMLNGEPLSLKDCEGVVILLEKELYDSSILLYHFDHNGIHIRVRISYVSLFDVEAVEGMTITTLAKALKPNYPSPENYETSEWAGFVEDKTITVNGESVFARITTATGVYYDRVEYLYDGYYVAIEAPDFVEFYEEFFENFTIQ